MAGVETAPRQLDPIDSAIQAIEARGGFVTPFTPESETGGDSLVPTVRRKKAGRLTGAALAGGLGVALVGGLGAPTPVSASENQHQAIVTEGQMPSLQMGQIMEATVQTTAETLIKLTSPEAAVARYGYDSYSKNPNNWVINEFGGAMLKPDQTGKVHRIRVGGAIWDAWLKVDRTGITAVPMVINARTSYMDIQGGTAWLLPASQREQGFADLLAKLRTKELTEQPGTNVIPVCTPLNVETRWVPVAKMTAKQAAVKFGRDAYTKNYKNWGVNKYGAPYINPDKSGLAHKINATGVVVDGWLAIDRVSGYDALPFVASPQGPLAFQNIDVQGATIWIPQRASDRNALHWQVLRQLRAREALEQPGTLVTSFCN